MANTSPRRRPPAKPAAAAAPKSDLVDKVQARLEAEADNRVDPKPEQGVEPEPTPADTQYRQLSPAEADRMDFVATLRAIAQAEVPYDRLLQAIRDDGWFLHLRELGCIPQHDGGTLVAFSLLMGTSPVHTQEVDRITISAPGGTPMPSFWARANAYSSIIMALFNIFPPKAEAEAAPAARPASGTPAATRATAEAVAAADQEPLDMIEGRTADGLPLFFNPFELNEDPAEMIQSVLDVLREEVPDIASSQALATLFSENKDMFDYIRETQPAIFDEIRVSLLDARAAQLADLETPAAKTAGRTTGRRPAAR